MKFPILLIILFKCVSTVSAQTFIMGGPTAYTCTGFFYDAGGPNGKYPHNQNNTFTICPVDTGTYVRLAFPSIQLVLGDELCFYDGPNLASALLSCSSDYPNSTPAVVQATLANPSGCLTMHFTSNHSGNDLGWAAEITCVAGCQIVQAKINQTLPPALPVDTGWIDICLGTEVTFSGGGIYPQSGIVYTQSDQSSKLEWTFDDGGTAQGPTVTHRFDKPGGYNVQLKVKDRLGCSSTNLEGRRVRVAPKPKFVPQLARDTAVCSGATLALSASVGALGNANLSVLKDSATFSAKLSRSDSLALPDGTGVPYQATIDVADFPAGFTVEDAGELEAICLNIEHSYVRDLQITLTCPNGQSVLLHDFAGKTGPPLLLGIPNDLDAINPQPGTGFDYCWTEPAMRPHWLQYAKETLGGKGTLPPGDYQPEYPFSGLIGCPLNGAWTLTATDLWPIDNGFLFSWGLRFRSKQFNIKNSFSPDLTEWGWSNNSDIIFGTPDQITASPPNAGTARHTFQVKDAFGCNWDTTFLTTVLPPTHPDCYKCNNILKLRDTAICVGASVQFDLGAHPKDTAVIRFESYPGALVGFAQFPSAVPFATPLPVSGLNYPLLTNPIQQIEAVCVDLESDFAGDLELFLLSPDGKKMELSTRNGSGGQNYTKTCFTPAATLPIAGAPAPFTGDFVPEGDWAALTGARIDGAWSLLVSDASANGMASKLLHWNIDFKVVDSTTFSWTNPGSLSCSDCPLPLASPDTPTTYVAAASNSFNCHWSDTVQVGITALFPAPSQLEMIDMRGDSMVWRWSAVPGALGYEVQVNNGAWQAANGGLRHSIRGLISGQVIDFQVRALVGFPNCPPDVKSQRQVFVVCTLDAALNGMTPATCADSKNGSVRISSVNGVLPVRYVPNGIGPAFLSGNITNFFAPGAHFVVALDTAGCRDTVRFNISSPGPFTVSATASPALCNGDNSGAVSATPGGGVGSISYSWQDCTGFPMGQGPTLNNLPAACYQVTAVDANGCRAIDTVQVTEPAMLELTTLVDTVDCFGGADGAANISIKGGTAPYQVDWSNGAGGQTVGALKAGFYAVTVTDANSCQVVTLVLMPEPMELNLDSTVSRAATCFDLDNGTALVSPSGGVSPYQFVWNDGQTTQKAINLTAGTYVVTVSDAKGCFQQRSVEVTAPPAFGLDFVNVVNELCTQACNGAAMLDLRGGTMPYTVSWTDTLLGNRLQVGNLCVGKYPVLAEDANGCSVTDTLLVGAPNPMKLQLNGKTPTCQGIDDGRVESVVSGGVAPYQYLWNTGSNTPALQNVACDTFRLTVRDATGCALSDTLVFNCPPSVEIIEIVDKKTRCYGSASGSLTVKTKGGSGLLQYEWSDSNRQVDSTASNLSAGIYTVTVRDALGCSASARDTVFQPDSLIINVLKTDIRCRGEKTGAATIVPSNGTAPYRYLWNNGFTTVSSDTLGTGIYFVTVTDTNGCSATSPPFEIEQPALALLVSASQTQKSCFNQAMGMATTAVSGGNPGVIQYLWSNGERTPQAMGLKAGAASVTVTDEKGCAASADIAIQQYDSIEVSVGFRPPTCHADRDGAAAINFIRGGAGAGNINLYNFIWNIPTTPNAQVLINLEGDKTYSVTATDQVGCTGSFSFTPTQPPLVVVKAGVTDATCHGKNDGVATVAVFQSVNPPTRYLWSNNTTEKEARNLRPGLYFVTVYDSNGCFAYDSASVREPTPITLAFSATTLLCTNDKTAKIGVAVKGGTPGFNFKWNTGSVNDTIFNNGGGRYTVTVTDKNNCTVVEQYEIIKPDSLDIQSVVTQPRCFGAANGKLELRVSGGQTPYSYSFNNSPFESSETFLRVRAGAFLARVRDRNGCITTKIVEIGQPPLLVVDLPPDTTLRFGDTLLLQPTLSAGISAADYDWTSLIKGSFGCADSTLCAAIRVYPQNADTYKVLVTDQNGCTGTASLRIGVEKPEAIFVPTGFSPNDDSSNDRLIVHGASRYVREVLVFQIFNRWGEMVFEDRNFKVNSTDRGWDGTFRDQSCAPGVYVWQLKAAYMDGKSETLSGSITLIK